MRVVSLDHASSTDMVVKRATSLVALDGMPDGSGFLAVDALHDGTRRLLFVDRQGGSTVLWSPPELHVERAFASPNCRQMALVVGTQQNDAWMISESPTN